MKIVKKYLYLLQLEEYETQNFFKWLKKNNIQRLEERKNRLHWTPRVIFTILLSLPLFPFLGIPKTIGSINQLAEIVTLFPKEVLIKFATLKLKFYPNLIKIIITGSYGKTTFKEMLSFVLSEKYSVLKTSGNINTNAGIALAILKSLKKNHQIFVVEAGAYYPGEIKKICQMIKPNFGIVTIIGWMHLSKFGTLNNIRQTKLEIVPFIADSNKLFVPKKDHVFIDFEKTLLKIAEMIGIDEKKAREKLKSFQAPQNRLEIKKISHDITVLNDVYNSNPLGFKRALDKLKEYTHEQKVVATPGMIELGEKQEELNEQLLKEAGQIADLIIIIGETNKEALTRGAISTNKSVQIIYIDSKENFYDVLPAYLKPPSVILHENDLPDHYF